MMTLFSKWWDNNTKLFEVTFYPRQIFRCFFCVRSNGAKKGIDRCFDGSVWILGICFNYVNWNYSRNLKK